MTDAGKSAVQRNYFEDPKEDELKLGFVTLETLTKNLSNLVEAAKNIANEMYPDLENNLKVDSDYVDYKDIETHQKGIAAIQTLESIGWGKDFFEETFYLCFDIGPEKHYISLSVDMRTRQIDYNVPTTFNPTAETKENIDMLYRHLEPFLEKGVKEE